tara:strand:+ start:1355 stop:1573 length:219 start_codon:yes stop_codon:yes gene_type:complete
MSNQIEKEKKSEVIEKMLEEVSKHLGTPRSIAFKTGVCVMCSKEATSFRDAMSEREYSISGMCQECQDNIWG